MHSRQNDGILCLLMQTNRSEKGFKMHKYLQIWGWFLPKKFTSQPKGGGRSGNCRGSKNQKCGKYHELPRKVLKKSNRTPPHQGLGVLKGKNFKCQTFHDSRKSIFLVSPPPTPSDGGGGQGRKFQRNYKHEVLKSISGMQFSCVIITLQIFWAKPGKPREGG